MVGEEDDEDVKILDTRLIARQPLCHLTGAAAELLRAARDAIREEALVEKLVDNYTTAEIEDALALLVQENLMLHIGDEYLALPVDRFTTKK